MLRSLRHGAARGVPRPRPATLARVPARINRSLPRTRWVVPVVVFVIAALVTVMLRDAPGEQIPVPEARPAGDVAAAIPTSRLGNVPDLPAPLAAPPRPRAKAATPRAKVAAPAATPTPDSTPAPAPTPQAAIPAPAAPAPEPKPRGVVTPQSTPAPVFDDSGTSPEIDDSGP